MERYDIRDSIVAQFGKSAKLFCEDTNGLFCEISKEYKGVQESKNLQYCFAKIYYNAFVVKIIYTAHAAMKVVNSILGCSVCFEKTEDALEIPLPLITDYCNVDITAPMFIPFITNEAGMVQAFSCIGDVLKKLLPSFIAISCNTEYQNKILTAYTDEIKYVFKLDALDDVLNFPNLVLYNYFTLRFTSKAFINFMKGNTAKAIVQLKKEKRLTGYESRLQNLWLIQEAHEIPELSSIIKNAQAYNENGVQKANMKEFGAMFLSWLLITPETSALFLGLYFLFVWIEGRQSVCLLGPSYNFPLCIVFGLVTAVALSYFTRFKFYKWLYKKDYEAFCEMDSIQNDGASDKLMKGFVTFLLIVGVTGCALLAKWNLNFLPNGFVDNSRFLSLRGEYYTYDEIESVYYKPDRVNAFGETLDFPSYVLVLENGKEIDLYEHGEISDYENVLLEYFRNKGVKIEDLRAQ